MNPVARAFRNAAAQACTTRNYSFHRLMADGLEGVLEEADANGWDGREIVVQFLHRCCVEDGRFNNSMVGLLTVMAYLNEHFGPRGNQTFTDMVSVLNSGGSIATIRQWVSSHYP